MPRLALLAKQNRIRDGHCMTKLTDLKKRLMRDPGFREEYTIVDEEYELVAALVCAREAANLTQAELARRIGTTRGAIARLGRRHGIPRLRLTSPIRCSHRNASVGEPHSGRPLMGWGGC